MTADGDLFRDANSNLGVASPTISVQLNKAVAEGFLIAIAATAAHIQISQLPQLRSFSQSRSKIRSTPHQSTTKFVNILIKPSTNASIFLSFGSSPTFLSCLLSRLATWSSKGSDSIID